MQPPQADGPAIATPPVELTAPASPTPLQGNERIEIIDIIRGIALFGIIAANMRGFAAPAQAYYDTLSFTTTWYDTLAQALVDIFIQGKFITIFAVLFGIGFSVQLRRAEMRGGGFGSLHFRRMAVLGLIGLVHGLFIWWGDILLVYAVTGLLLTFFRNCRNRTIAGWMFVLYVFPLALSYAAIGLIALVTRLGQTIPMPPSGDPALLEPMIRAYTSGWSEIQSARMTEYVTKNLAFTPVSIPHVLSMFLAGLLAWRKRLFAPSPEQLPAYRKWMVISLTLGATMSAGATIFRVVFDVGTMDLRPIVLIPGTLQFLATPLMSLGYVTAIILLFQRPGARERLHGYAAVGRTALTNYLAQSVLGTMLFYGYGLGFYGRMGPALLVIPTLVIYGLQVWLSPIWLRTFRFGPVEWLWRSLAYMRIQPLRRSKIES